MPAALRGPLSAAWAQACHAQHGHLDWIAAQCSPLTCEEERLYDWAALYGVDRLLATPASGAALATGTPGAQLLAGTVLRGANGLDYTVSAAVIFAASSATVSLSCTAAGSDGNLPAGAVLSLVDPVMGCDNVLTVDAAGLTGGAADELLEDWRLRVADEWTTVTTLGARSGKPDDYRAWAKGAHPSVTTALVQLHALGFGTVTVRPICNSLAGRLPTPAVLDAVAAKLAGVSPAGADWSVTAPIPHLVAVGLHLLAGVDTAANRTAIDTAVASLLASKTSENALLDMAEIDAAVATVTTHYSRTAPLADITAAEGEVLVLSAVNWS